MNENQTIRPVLSELGKNFKNQLLSENDLEGGKVVLYRNKTYRTGNRYDDVVELYTGHVFIKTVKMSKIQLIGEQNPLPCEHSDVNYSICFYGDGNNRQCSEHYTHGCQYYKPKSEN